MGLFVAAVDSRYSATTFSVTFLGMDTENGVSAVAVDEPGSRRTGDERRAESERRRSAKGLFEVRARREGAATDRRQGDRRDEQSAFSWLAFWRRAKR